MIEVEKTVLLTVDIDVYDDGVGMDLKNWNNVEINMSRLQSENDLLRKELSKFGLSTPPSAFDLRCQWFLSLVTFGPENPSS